MPVASAAKPAQTSVRADIRPAAAQRAGRSWFRAPIAPAVQALAVAPSRAVQHPSRPVVKTAPKKAEGAPAPRKPRKPQPPVVVIPASGLGAAVARWALTQVGKRYVYGTAGPYTYDCSGLSMAAWLRVGIRLPHNADAQRRYGRAVTRAQLQPGDLIFYPGHVGIFVGGGMMVAAATPSEGVKYQRIYGTPSAYRRMG